MHPLLKSIVILYTTAAGYASAADDLLVADFEGDSYAPWKVSGEAFGGAPAHGPLPGQMNVEGFKGKGLVNSFHKGDDSTGSLTSPEFRIERKLIAFLIGGGMKPDTLALQLVVDVKVVRKATGPNDRPGGSETLQQESWNVTEFAGKTATIRIIDEAKGGWGHLNVDHIVQTDVKPKGPPALVNNAGNNRPHQNGTKIRGWIAEFEPAPNRELQRRSGLT